MRQLVLLGLAGAMILIGVYILANQAFVGGLIQSYGGSAADTSGASPFGTTSYIVYAIGLGIIGSGVGILRMSFHRGVSRLASGPQPQFDPAALQGMMAASMAQMAALQTPSAAPTAEVVKLKCRNCGSLEPEDAAFCRKCGQAM